MLAVVSAGSVAWINLGQGPDAVDQYGIAQEGDAFIATSTAIGLVLAGSAAGALTCMEGVVICQGDMTAVAKAEKRETKIELSSRAATTVQQTELFLRSMNNSLSGAKMVARSEGMIAYRNAIQNGSSLAVAKQKAKRAVEDFYTVKYRQVAKAWNIMATMFYQYDNIEENSSIPSGYVRKTSGTYHYNDLSMTNKTVTAPNSTQITFVSLDGMYPTGVTASGKYFYQVGAINSSFATVSTPYIYEFAQLLNKIDSDMAEVKQSIETVANQTYQKAINGKINVSNYLSANTLAYQYSRNGRDQAWAAIRLSQMKNVGLPENLKNIGTVTISSGGSTVTGLFLSKSNPASGSFKVNQTYNATKLPGKQMVVKESGSYATISGKFTIEKITTPDGESIQNMTIQNPDYKVTNTSDWRKMIEQMQELRAEINARQQALMNDSGGGGGLFNFSGLAGSLPFGGAGVLAALGAIVVLGLVTRD